MGPLPAARRCPHAWGMSSSTLVRVRVAFADDRHARRALGIIAMAADLPIEASMRDEATALAVFDIEVVDNLSGRLEGLLRMAGGVLLPA